MQRFAGITRARVFGGITVDRIGQSAAAPVMGASNPGTVRTLPGGVGFNVASALARLGLEVALVGRVGGDADGTMLHAAAAAAALGTSGLGTSSTAPTATYHATLDNEGGLVIGIADMRVYDEMTPEAIGPALDAALPREFWVIDANLPVETLAFVAAEAHARERPLAALSVSPVKAKRLTGIVDRLTLLIANRREAAAILGRAWRGDGPPAADLAGELVARGAGAAIVTDSSAPLAVALDGEVRMVAPFRAAVSSVNGAGDAFAGGTLWGLAMGRSLFDAVLPGLAAAALTVESAENSRRDIAPRLIEDFLAAREGTAR